MKNIFSKEVSHNALFEEGVYLSSKELWHQLQKKDKLNLKESKKLRETVFKYWLRSSTRCTPFGTFAGSGLLKIGDSVDLILDAPANYKRKIRIDMDYMSLIISNIEKVPDVKANLKFYVNNSLYETADEFRYAEYLLAGRMQNYNLSFISKSPYLTGLIKRAKTGATLSQMCDFLIREFEVAHEEAQEFLDELWKCQIILSELETAVTGLPPLTQLIEKLIALKVEGKLVQNLIEIDNLLAEPRPEISFYEKAVSLLNELQPITHEIKNIFQVDLFLSFEENNIGNDIISALSEQVKDLTAFSVPIKSPSLEEFKRTFNSKYENLEMPLNFLLDADLGIGYGNTGPQSTHGSEWIDDIPTAIADPGAVNVDFIQTFILNKYHHFLKGNESTINVSEQELADLQRFVPNSSFSNGMFAAGSILGKGDKFNVDNFEFELNQIGTMSAATLMARFAHGDQEICKKVKYILEEEESAYPHIIFAEIVHLPQPRLGNILLRPILREFEIPFVGRSGMEHSNQITLDDLMVSVQDNKVILRSIRLNKQVIPRLTTAHNYHYHTMSVYKFLCDIQHQGLRGMVPWNWGPLINDQFLPRVTYKNVILKKAQWQIKERDLSDLENNELLSYFEAFRAKFNMPEIMIFAEGDNKLVINFFLLDSIQIFLGLIKKYKVMTLEEFLFDEKNCIVRDKSGDPFTNEVIIPFYNDDHKVFEYKNLKNRFSPAEYFPPNGEWLYYKLYCSPKSQERILIDKILPFIVDLQERQQIEKFFFVRYYDELPHLRIRFFNSNVELNRCVQIVFDELLIPLVKTQIIHKVLIDTYIPEVNRYGENLIRDSETIFFNDSCAILKFLGLLDDQESEFYKIFVGMRSIDLFLDDFYDNVPNKYDIIRQLADGFLKEFGGGNDLRKRLNEKYRRNQKAIRSFMSPIDDEKNGIDEAIALFKYRSLANAGSVRNVLAQSSPEEIASRISSFMHMSVNRFFVVKQRKYELIIYTFLERYYTTVMAQQKYLVSNEADGC